MPTKMREKKASEGKVNALQRPLQLSEDLAAVIGSGPLPLGPGGEQDLGVHPLAQPAKPGGPPRNRDR
jgi:hypothetical protein